MLHAQKRKCILVGIHLFAQICTLHTMNFKLTLLTILLQIFTLTVLGQKPACKSLHTGSFKIFTEESGNTLINRTEKLQTEKNDNLGYEIIFDIVWINECTYELRPKKLIKGDPAIMGDGTHVITTRIKNISNKSYLAETSANFSDAIFDFEVEIMR